jgi:hypothetical protein
VGQASAKKIAFVVEKDLGLVFEAAKGAAMNDAVAIPLVFRAVSRRRLGLAPPARRAGAAGVGSQP